VTLDTGDTAWLLLSSALVLLMTPGLAFFYGGLNRSKSVLNMMMMSFSSIGLISILWLIYGFSGAFGADRPIGSSAGIIGNLGQYWGGHVFTSELGYPFAPSLPIPTYVVLAFQMMFAIITVALISGGISDRTKFAGWLLFAAGWFTLAYIPIAHMVWGGGFLGVTVGELDFAGGSAVHINAGAAALALALLAGRRVGWPKESFRPHNVPFVALGAGLLWFGWFGFNAGSELTADNVAAIAFVNTQVATAAALLGWILVEWFKNGKPTLVGASSGAVAGLVAITPACAYIAPYAAALLGLVAGAICALAVGLKYRLGFDDSLDVVGVHFVGGWIGCIWIGFFATKQSGFALTHEGLVYNGGFHQLISQLEGAGVVTVWSFVVALVVGFVVKITIGLRVKPEAEIEGIDVAEHAESAYDFTSASGGGGHSGGAFALAGIASGGTTGTGGGAHAADPEPAQPAKVSAP
jgi:Amt family ammonium transporter